MPEIPAGERLVDIWHEVGCAKTGFNGVEPFGWIDLTAYQQATKRELSPAESLCLIEMSRAYASASRDDKPLSIAPMERSYD